MHSFKNDYSEGAHPRILEALGRNNFCQEEGYGLDRHTEAFAGLLREKMGSPSSAVHLIPGGTQTNLSALAAFLRPHEACIAAETGHIATHETGAVEATGHKVLTVPGREGKLFPDLIEPVLEEHHFEHMVRPRMVYISQPTELGTLYSRQELEVLSEFCRSRDLYLYADGARLGAALTAEGSDTGLGDMARLTDAFFIGGTKNGALYGEALVLNHPRAQEDFRYLMKQRGGLLGKGWIMGLQFLELFRDDLYFDLARRANERAQLLARGLAGEGCSFLVPSRTNQIFPVLPLSLRDALLKEFSFYPWPGGSGGSGAMRLITSWATTEEAATAFLEGYRRAASRS